MTSREGGEGIQLVPGKLLARLPLLSGFSSKEARGGAIANASRLLVPANIAKTVRRRPPLGETLQRWCTCSE